MWLDNDRDTDWIGGGEWKEGKENFATQTKMDNQSKEKGRKEAQLAHAAFWKRRLKKERKVNPNRVKMTERGVLEKPKSS